MTENIFCPLCGESEDVGHRGGNGDESIYYCQACDHEFLASESGKVLVYPQSVFCPLCDSPMHQDGRYYRCIGNQLHVCLVEEEWNRYNSREKDIKWLKWRMKVRLGKLVHGR